MPKYQFAAQQHDGSWRRIEFTRHDDDAAVAFALSNRTMNVCELFCGDHLLAEFDAAIAPDVKGLPVAEDVHSRNFDWFLKFKRRSKLSQNLT